MNGGSRRCQARTQGGRRGERTLVRDPRRPTEDAAWRRLEPSFKVAVLHPDDHSVATLEGTPDAVGDGYRAVSASGAADRDRQVALALGNVSGDEELE